MTYYMVIVNGAGPDCLRWRQTEYFRTREALDQFLLTCTLSVSRPRVITVDDPDEIDYIEWCIG